jgi:ABC-2 type transport system ATP-binding protein
VSVKVNNITKLYGKQKALNNVSFEVKQGEIIGFLGPNGAGKSTMMKIITCFIPPSSGKVEVCGYDVAEQSIEVRRNVGYLPEHNPLYLDMYVKEYLKFIAGLHKIGGANAAKRIAEMIEITGLQLEQHKKIGALSKGYRQRVGLAQALIHDPKVLILDEPTTGLDPNQLAEIRNLIREVGKEKTVMFSTHIMQEVKAVCDRVIIVNKGEIVANDITSNIQQQNDKSVVLVIEFDNKVEKALLLEIPGVLEVKDTNDYTWVITTDASIDVRPSLFNFAVKNNLSVLGLQKREQSLEEVFQQLTR